jgi:sugar/nucleoside kinase (ribokinase family)
MSIMVVGSVAFDGIKTRFGQVDKVLGGSASYFSLAASYFTHVRIVAVVGEDFTDEYEQVFRKRGIDVSGIQREKGDSFFWRGEYGENPNEAKTLTTDLNVFEHFNPEIPQQYRDTNFLFLANIDPVLQANVRRQMSDVALVGGDTMNFWINGKRQELIETLKLIDVLLINDTETKSLANESILPRAAQKVLAMGPKALVIKHGEYGATIFFREGDSFAGGFMGYIASQGELNREVLKRAMFYGGVMGSFAVERFGPERLMNLSREEIEERFGIFRELTHLD